MKRLPIAILFFFWIKSPLTAQVFISNETDSLIQLGIRYSIEQSFKKAIVIFSKIEQDMPESPVGYFFHAAALHSKMLDSEIYEEEKEFISLVKKTIKLSNLHLEKQPRDPWAYFFLGGGLGYLAFYQAKQKKFVQAFQNGMLSVKALKKAIKADSSLYDVYFGLGTYTYYRSKLSRFLSWLPFIGDERVRGINMIKLAIQKGKYSRYAAMNGLCWILIEEGNLKESWQVVNKALDEFPESRIFLWCAAETATKLKRWEQALTFYNKILTSLTEQKVLSPYNEVSCRQRIAKIYFQLNNYKKALRQCEKVNNIKLDKETRKMLAHTLKKLENIHKACNRHLEKSYSSRSTN